MTKLRVKHGTVSYRVNGQRTVAQVGDVIEVSPEIASIIDPRFIEVIPEQQPGPILVNVKVVEEPIIIENPLPEPTKKRVRKPIVE